MAANVQPAGSIHVTHFTHVYGTAHQEASPVSPSPGPTWTCKLIALTTTNHSPRGDTVCPSRGRAKPRATRATAARGDATRRRPPSPRRRSRQGPVTDRPSLIQVIHHDATATQHGQHRRLHAPHSGRGGRAHPHGAEWKLRHFSAPPAYDHARTITRAGRRSE